MNLFSAAERFASIDRSHVSLSSTRCLHSLYRNSKCEACYDICPVDAIKADGLPVLNVQSCQSCLACLPACPVGAYHADDAVASLLNSASRLDTETVELLCEMHPQPDTGGADSTGIRVRGCLAGLGSGAYLLLASLGVRRIVARADACRACCWAELSAEVERQVLMAGRFLEAWGGLSIIACQPEDAVMVERAVWESTNPPLSRRDLFRMAARQGGIALARAAEEGHAVEERKVGRDRLRTVNAVRNLSREHPTSSSHCGVFGFASLRVSDACTACGVCANACPTGALHFEVTNSNGSFSLRFSGPDCIDCGICENVCAAVAIRIDHDPAFKEVFGTEEPVSVQSGELTRCAQCNTLMAARPGIKLCPLCSYRRKNPFGTKIPPGMNRSGFSVKRKGDS